MFTKKECVVMLLAGGRGSRLLSLTEKIAKPVVSFGGKYNIIDFAMSNCVNSAMYTVGVLTQYQPLILNEYIGNGQPWDLDRINGGVTVLPPYQRSESADWYSGTANAIYQNMEFINRYDPDYVVVLSGDHIYKMDYSKMLDFHKENNSDCTIAVIDVPIEEASRFGIMNTDEFDRITAFEEKPKHPKSTKASMGIYIFNKDLLENYLEEDDRDENSDNDFGKNVIPKMLSDKRRMFAYTFKGYWKDVGTIPSLWQANMDLLGERPRFDLSDPAWKILSRSDGAAPHFVGDCAKISNSLVTEGCTINGLVENSVLSSNVTIEKGAIVKDSVIMTGVTIEEGAVIKYAIVDKNTVIKRDDIVGKEKESHEIALVTQKDIQYVKM